jgi:hypothetical protein
MYIDEPENRKIELRNRYIRVYRSLYKSAMDEEYKGSFIDFIYAFQLEYERDEEYEFCAMCRDLIRLEEGKYSRS